MLFWVHIPVTDGKVPAVGYSAGCQMHVAKFHASVSHNLL